MSRSAHRTTLGRRYARPVTLSGARWGVRWPLAGSAGGADAPPDAGTDGFCPRPRPFARSGGRSARLEVDSSLFHTGVGLCERRGGPCEFRTATLFLCRRRASLKERRRLRRRLRRKLRRVLRQQSHRGASPSAMRSKGHRPVASTAPVDNRARASRSSLELHVSPSSNGGPKAIKRDNSLPRGP
jgi:hypothetical protein